MADKLRQATELEQLHRRHLGTLDADSSRWRWLVGVKRDTNALIVGTPWMLAYDAVAHGRTTHESRLALVEGMVRPCGPPPPSDAGGAGR